MDFPPCPDPRCCDGTITIWAASPHYRQARVVRRCCPTCGGAGNIDERAQDLWQAGIVASGATDEDFRSSPTHWRP